ncbi:MAG TPA: mechanosensitive ion channel family protein [Polyangia bacterium]|nr:mechanosensitive ion channel family protein [Polyangia bacterium]
MGFWDQLIAEAREDYTLAVVVGLVFMSVVVRVFAPEDRARTRAATVLVALHMLLLPIAAWLRMRTPRPAAYADLRLAAWVFETVAAVGLAGILLFTLVLPRVRLRTPRILRDVIGAAASIVVIFVLAARAGHPLSGIIATSAVVTAVIGLSLQDTLGNIMAGLALQMDNSIEVGDWVKVGDLVGIVRDIHWRSTMIETRNWETVVVPNSALVKNQFLILGRRQGAPIQWRRSVWFNVDFRYPPPEVIAAVSDALRAAPIDCVAADPPPQVVLMDLGESYARYAVRYFLSNLMLDDPTDGVVRTRVYFALRRVGISLSIPAHAIFVTEDTSERKASKQREEGQRRLAALDRVEFFEHLEQADRARLAQSLRYAPFARGEIMTRQGAEAHWLYMIIAGDASVRVAVEGGLEREVARLSAGNFFGEMSLMTGECRSATVVALSDVECYRLDKAAFQDIIHERPELAEKVAEVLARRRLGLVAVRENLDAAARERRLAADKHALLGRIRQFFGLAADGRRVTVSG